MTTAAVAGVLNFVQLVAFGSFGIRCCLSALTASQSYICIVFMVSNLMVISVGQPDRSWGITPWECDALSVGMQ